MRTTSTIWETASRPLFVRSVWLEAANEGRTLRRHFILDYEPKERERMRTATTAGTSPTRKRRASFRQSNSYDEYEHARFKLNESFDHLDDEDTCMLLDATKLKLQQQQQQQQQQHQQPQSSTRHCLKTSRSSRRRSWLQANRKSATCYSNHSQASRELYSRRSSLQELQTWQGPNPEERLAERVLNWLDLAGKTDILRAPSREPATMGKEATTTTTTTTTASRNQRRCVRTRAESRNEPTPTRRAFRRVPTANAQATQRISALAQRRTTTSSKQLQQQQQLQAPACQHSRPDSVKPITIIFNKEGIPVRLNRPARNIDLCALSSSSSTTRRLAGRLASARLYPAAPHSAGRDDSTHKLTLTPPHSNRSQHDANKKQLHIFMPSLPKKGLLMSMGSSCGGDSGSGLSYPGLECDADSALNQAFSELCRI